MGPERTSKSSTSMNRLSLPAHVAHLGFSLLSEPSSTCLGLQISRFSAASAICALSHMRLSCFRIISRTRLFFEEFLKALAALRFAEKHTWIVFTLEVRTLRTKLSMSWWRFIISTADVRAIYQPHGPAETDCLTLIEET